MSDDNRNGKYEVVKLLLEMSAKVDLRDGKGNTSLHFAAGWGDYTSAVMILEVRWWYLFTINAKNDNF